MTLDYLLDSMMVLTDAEFVARHRCSKNAARRFIEGGEIPEGWRPAVFVAHDTRPADAIADAMYYPAECFVCQGPVMQGSQYCSEAHRKIQDGEPTYAEHMGDL